MWPQFRHVGRFRDRLALRSADTSLANEASHEPPEPSNTKPAMADVCSYTRASAAREKPPRAGHALKGVHTAILEGNPRTVNQILDSA